MKKIGLWMLLMGLGLSGVQAGYDKTYNGLPQVEAQAEQIKSVNMSKVAAAVAVVAERFGLTDKVCLRLIHKHFPVTPGQVMVQVKETVDGKVSLVTRAMSMEAAKQMGATVASWIFQGDTVVPFEYAAGTCPEAGANFEAFLSAVRPILYQHGVLNTISVALLPTLGQTMGHQAVLMEVNEKAGAQSIVQVVPGSASKNTIITGWNLKGNSTAIAGEPNACASCLREPDTGRHER